MADGYLSKCIECKKKQREAYAKSDVGRETIRQYEIKRLKDPKRKEKARRYQKIHRSKYPEKYRARSRVGNALRDGVLFRKNCEVCGNEKSEAHHEDYSKPLEVIWLCKKHHREADIKLKDGNE